MKKLRVTNEISVSAKNRKLAIGQVQSIQNGFVTIRLTGTNSIRHFRLGSCTVEVLV